MNPVTAWKEGAGLVLRALYLPGALLVVAFVTRFVPLEVQSIIVVVTVWGGPFAVGLLFSIYWMRWLFALFLASAVAPAFIFLVFLLVPSKPGALDVLAYVFGSIYGFVAASAGVLLSFAFRDKAKVSENQNS